MPWTVERKRGHVKLWKISVTHPGIRLVSGVRSCYKQRGSRGPNAEEATSWTSTQLGLVSKAEPICLVLEIDLWGNPRPAAPDDHVSLFKVPALNAPREGRNFMVEPEGLKVTSTTS